MSLKNDLLEQKVGGNAGEPDIEITSVDQLNDLRLRIIKGDDEVTVEEVAAAVKKLRELAKHQTEQQAASKKKKKAKAEPKKAVDTDALLSSMLEGL